MELRHLRYFEAVAAELHFGRAARRLHISQPPLSQQIQALEAELGVRLFDRRGHKVGLTEAGQELLPRARALLAQAQAAKTAAQRAGRGESGVLEIAFTGSVPFTAVFPRLLRRFRQDYPDVELRLQELNVGEQIERLRAELLDVGMIRPPRTEVLADLETALLLREELLLVMPRDHRLAAITPLHLGMFAAEPFVMYSRSSANLADYIHGLCLKAGFSPRVVQEVFEMPTAIGLVAAGVGVALVSASMRRIRAPGVIYRKLSDEGAWSEILLTHRRGAVSPALAHFLAAALAARDSA
jgi:DNA-binding transcriptional LysR family regulator